MELATEAALAKITDDGLFERLAAAVLRLEPAYAALAHPGVNEGGKTVKAPLDGIAIVDNGGLLLAVHHTTTAVDGLRRKWLLDPATVRPRKNARQGWKPPPAGDIVKTLEIVREERARAPSLRATLILTTNQEVDQELYRDAVAAGRAENVTIDIWTRTRISQSLDVSSAGQFIRRKLLGIEEELISRDLLAEIANQSITHFHAGDQASARIRRQVDDILSASEQPLTIVAGASGVGKTVAVLKAVSVQVDKGRIALVMPHEAIEQSTTLDQAIMKVLIQYKPKLDPGGSPLALFSEEDPLVLMIEDASRSNQPDRLVTKLSEWISPDKKGDTPFCLALCPVWPHLLSRLPNKVRDHLAPMIVRLDVMSAVESSRAVTAHATANSVQLQPGHADQIAAALGHDPLLIGLNRDWVDPRPAEVIGSFVENTLQRVEANGGPFSSTLHLVLLALGSEMLRHRSLDPSIEELSSWDLSSEDREVIRLLCRFDDLIRTEGSSTNQRLRFRHDRVRDWVLTTAAIAMDARGELDTAIFSEPMLADIVGAMLVRTEGNSEQLKRASAESPLALFEARRQAPSDSDLAARISGAALAWLEKEENRTDATASLRWQALAALEGLIGKDIIALVNAFPGEWYAKMQARLYNGDLAGGIALCGSIDLMIAADWTRQAAELLYDQDPTALRRKMTSIIDKALDKEEEPVHGIICFAGVLGDPVFASPLQNLWGRDGAREERLQSYLWAFARCATPATAANLLDPVCTIWAALPATTDKEFEVPARFELAGDTLRFAFRRIVPVGALDYFIRRAGDEDLRWPIEYMLQEVDDPRAVLFEARLGADNLRRKDDTYFFRNGVRDHWARAHREGRPMSVASRNALFAIWTDKNCDAEYRMSAFDIWVATHGPDDLVALKQHYADEALADRILRARLERYDRSAVPLVIGKLSGKKPSFWWQFTRQVWSPELHEALDQALERLETEDEDSFLSSILISNLIHLPAHVAEQLLLKHWRRLSLSGDFVIAALYIATPTLLERVRQVIATAHEPAALLKHLSAKWGIRITGEAGVTRQAQIEGIGPYLALLDSFDVEGLAATCNKNGWFELRRRLIDPHREAEKLEKPDRFLEQLDAALARASPFIDHGIDLLLEAGVPWTVLASTLEEWLSKQSSESALQVAAQAIGHAGARPDIARLSSWAGDNLSLLGETTRNVNFVVKRRSRL